MEILAGLLSAGSGGLLGGIFAFATNWFKAKEEAKKLEADRQFELLKWEREDNLFKLQMDKDAMEHEQESAIIQQQGSWNALDTSIQAESKIGATYKWVIAILKLFRPFLTVGLGLMTTYIFYSLVSSNDLNKYLSITDRTDIVRYVIYSIVFSFTTAVTWWFGERALTPPHRKDK